MTMSDKEAETAVKGFFFTFAKSEYALKGESFAGPRRRGDDAPVK
jgi:hypothetical protein